MVVVVVAADVMTTTTMMVPTRRVSLHLHFALDWNERLELDCKEASVSSHHNPPY
jgi:hypothetical protein